MLTNKDVGQLIPVLDCLHNKSSDAELQVTALIFILGHLPKVKGFFLIIFLCGLGPTSWKLEHFGLYLDSMERLDTEEMRFTAFWQVAQEALFSAKTGKVPKEVQEHLDILKDRIQSPVMEF